MEALPTSLRGAHLLQTSAPGATPCPEFPPPLTDLPEVEPLCVSWTRAGDVPPRGGGEQVVMERGRLCRAGGYGRCSLGALMFSETACPQYSYKPLEMPARLVA